MEVSEDDVGVRESDDSLGQREGRVAEDLAEGGLVAVEVGPDLLELFWCRQGVEALSVLILTLADGVAQSLTRVFVNFGDIFQRLRTPRETRVQEHADLAHKR